MTYHGGKVIVASGQADSSVGKVECRGALDQGWCVLAELPRIIACALLSFGGEILVIGGFNTTARVRSDAIFCLQNDTWVDSMPRLSLGGRSHFAAAAFKGQIWICGGLLANTTQSGTITNTVEIYNPTSKKWIQGPSLTRTRFQCRLFALGNELFAVGGDMQGMSSVLGTIEKLNESTYTWEIVTHFPQRRSRSASATLGTKIYIFGGADGSVLLPTWDAFDTDTLRWESQTSESTPECFSQFTPLVPTSSPQWPRRFLIPGCKGLTCAVATTVYDHHGT